MNNFIEIKNINKNFFNQKKINVLKNLNYNFKKGKIYSLVGPSGSGKSTFLNILSLIDRPSSGNLIINNEKINFDKIENNDQLRSNNFGIIYQEKNLLNDFTALENISLAGIANGKSYIESQKLAYAILKKLKLTNRSNHFPSELSGGENQRIAIGRALVNSPNIILADEPTGNLDNKTSKEVFSYFLKLKEKNKTIIIATHNRELAKKADYTLSISDGNIKRVNG